MGLYEHLKEQKQISGQVDSGLKTVLGKPQDGALTGMQNTKKRYLIEIVKSPDKSYYVNLSIDGSLMVGLPDYVPYRTLKAAVKEKYGIELPNVRTLEFNKVGTKHYARIDGTLEN